ncbi:MAG: helix-turn-helix domain-containing protein [Actinomycetota bacterium]|jgi:hypothetical protein|nr:helix-turn-helix domain-containing protein [Actinomycetota bacterium]
MSTKSDAWSDIRSIAKTLEEHLDEEATEIARLLQSQMAPYAELPLADVLAGVRTSLRSGVAALTDRRLPRTEEIEDLAAVAESRARQGIPLDLVLNAYSAGAHKVWGTVVTESRRRTVSAEVLLEAVQAVWAWTDVVTSQVASAYRRAEMELARHHQQHRTDFLRGLLTGSLGTHELKSQALSQGLDPALEYRALRARGSEHLAFYEVERELLAGGAHMVGIIGGDLAGVASARVAVHHEEITVGMGPPSPLSGLATSFAEATRLLRCAVGFAMHGVLDQEALGLRVAVFAEDSIGDLLIERLLTPLRRLRNDGSEVEESLRVYLAEGMRIGPAARRLYLHPNSLRYRLGKFQEATGADLSDTETVVQLWWALERARLAHG